MMKLMIATFCLLLLIACKQPATKPDNKVSEQQIHTLLDSFNAAAARADFDTYFSYYAPDAVFMGTDATERWNKEEFMKWSKPFFDRGKAWNFTSVQRHLYFDTTGTLAWFDELLNTQMKICRGSGVVIKQGNDWKVKQYVLSMTIPNALVDSIVPMKAAAEDAVLNSLKK
jgi:ketosteroid isomerase-like protein